MQGVKQEEEFATRSTEATQRFVALKDKLSKEEYNFEHFRTKHLLSDAQAIIKSAAFNPARWLPTLNCLASAAARCG